MGHALLQAFPEASPTVNILRVETTILQRFRNIAHLVDPKLVHLRVTIAECRLR